MTTRATLNLARRNFQMWKIIKIFQQAEIIVIEILFKNFPSETMIYFLDKPNWFSSMSSVIEKCWLHSNREIKTSFDRAHHSSDKPTFQFSNWLINWKLLKWYFHSESFNELNWEAFRSLEKVNFFQWKISLQIFHYLHKFQSEKLVVWLRRAQVKREAKAVRKNLNLHKYKPVNFPQWIFRATWKAFDVSVVVERKILSREKTDLSNRNWKTVFHFQFSSRRNWKFCEWLQTPNHKTMKDWWNWDNQWRKFRESEVVVNQSAPSSSCC